jgi:hypothetical protein
MRHTSSTIVQAIARVQASSKGSRVLRGRKSTSSTHKRKGAHKSKRGAIDQGTPKHSEKDWYCIRFHCFISFIVASA